jgi:hypothetical protein
MGKKMSVLERHITAYHEAAHAVMAFRFGIPVKVVTICDNDLYDKGRYGFVQFVTPPLIMAKHKKRRSTHAWPLLVRDTEHQAMVSLAGPVAEAKLFGTAMRSHTCESDLLKCFDLCELLNRHRNRPVEESTVAMANRLRRQTAQILGRPEVWRAIVAIAEDLKVWSQLTGPDAADTAQWTRRVRNQMRLLLPMPKNEGGSDESREFSRLQLHTSRHAAGNSLMH